MIVRATDEQVQEMCALAANASAPMGMGYLHFRPEVRFKAEDFPVLSSDSGVYLDYVQGRMVKLSLHRVGENEWQAADQISSEYESWVNRYPSYAELAEAAGATVRGR